MATHKRSKSEENGKDEDGENKLIKAIERLAIVQRPNIYPPAFNGETSQTDEWVRKAKLYVGKSRENDLMNWSLRQHPQKT